MALSKCAKWLHDKCTGTISDIWVWVLSYGMRGLGVSQCTNSYLLQSSSPNCVLGYLEHILSQHTTSTAHSSHCTQQLLHTADTAHNSCYTQQSLHTPGYLVSRLFFLRTIRQCVADARTPWYIQCHQRCEGHWVSRVLQMQYCLWQMYYQLTRRWQMTLSIPYGNTVSHSIPMHHQPTHTERRGMYPAEILRYRSR